MKKEEFLQTALRLYDFCEYPAVRYKIMFRYLEKPYDDGALTALRPAFLRSDVVEELYREQDRHGGWGKFQSKDYTAKDKFPTSSTAINRCLYLGLTYEDREILSDAYLYLKDLLEGRSREKFRNTNERVAPWNRASFCTLIEGINPRDELCDNTYSEWLYIAKRAFADGAYSYERERGAQHEVFWTREDRLVPMQTGLLLKRRDEISPALEHAMLLHYGGHAARYGFFWDKTLEKLPGDFIHKQTRRWFYTFNYINQFSGSALYLADAVDWLMASRNPDGLWDWGPQVKDPWGYFCNFSLNRANRYHRTVDCSMETLDFLKAYLDRNG